MRVLMLPQNGHGYCSRNQSNQAMMMNQTSQDAILSISSAVPHGPFTHQGIAVAHFFWKVWKADVLKLLKHVSGSATVTVVWCLRHSF